MYDRRMNVLEDAYGGCYRSMGGFLESKGDGTDDDTTDEYDVDDLIWNVGNAAG